MPGLTDWFDVFRCGTHLDHSGKWRTFTEADIDKAIASYQSDSAPIVVGHPTLNAPAFGWIQQFRRQGSTLQARASRVADEFADLVKRGLYKNRSISFNSDGTFRHVGFLGAAAPAVKGLEDIQFADKGEFYTMDTTENVQTDQAAAQEQAVEAQAEEVKKAQPEAAADVAPQSSRADAAPKSEPEVSLSDLESQQKQFQDTVKALESRIKVLENDLNAAQEKNRQAEFAAYADELIREGRLNPVAKAPLLNTMEGMFASDQANFASPENSVLNSFKSFLNMALPKNPVLFTGFAAPCEESYSVESLTPREIAIKARGLVEEQAAKGYCLDLGRAVRMVMEGGR